MNRIARTAGCLATLALTALASAQQTSIQSERLPEFTEVANRTMQLARSTVARLEVTPELGQAVAVQIPHGDAVITLDLVPHSPRSADYKLLHHLADGSYVEVEPGPVNTFRGFVEEIPGALVAASVEPDGFIAKIFMPGGEDNIIVEPMSRSFDFAGPRDIVVYRSSERDSDVAGICGTLDLANPNADGLDVQMGEGSGVSRGIDGIFVAELACDADLQYVIATQPDPEARINTIINTVNLQYERDASITHEISALVLRTSNASNPYDQTDSLGLVNQVLTVWNDSQMPTIRRDVVHLFTGLEINGSVIGRAATIGGICTDFNVCFSQAEYNGVFDCATALVTHELGHLWGAFHCDCVFNTMNPFNTCENEFAQVSIDSIINHRDSRPCLSQLEQTFTSLPFADEFPGNELNPFLWIGTDGTPQVNSDAIGEPSGDSSLNLTGTDQVRSALFDMSLQDNIVVTYNIQQTGGNDPPEPGEDLVLEFENNISTWIEVDRYFATGGAAGPFEFRTIPLPDAAEHNQFRLRLRNLSTTDGEDDFFVDNLSISASPVLPAAFSLTTPADGATGVSASPFFVWQVSDFAATYRLEVDDDEGFGSPELDTTVQSPVFSNPGFMLDDATEYFWRVTAFNINGETPANPTLSSFVVGTIPLDACEGDCNRNGEVDFADLVAALFQFGNAMPDECDADDSGNVDFADLVATLFNFGPCPE